jgi:hypothetical protein
MVSPREEEPMAFPSKPEETGSMAEKSPEGELAVLSEEVNVRVL